MHAIENSPIKWANHFIWGENAKAIGKDVQNALKSSWIKILINIVAAQMILNKN